MNTEQPETKLTVSYKDKNGTKVQIDTDTETARQIGQYRDVYNKRGAFALVTKEHIPHSPQGFQFETYAITAHSLRMTIYCTKICMPDSTIKYACKIANSKSPAEPVKELVAQLYFDLFDGCQQR